MRIFILYFGIASLNVSVEKTTGYDAVKVSGKVKDKTK